MQKRGQITIFIIVGLALVVLIGLLVYVYYSDDKGVSIEDKESFESAVFTVKNGIRSCALDSKIESVEISPIRTSETSLELYLAEDLTQQMTYCLGNLNSVQGKLGVKVNSLDKVKFSIVSLDPYTVQFEYPVEVSKGRLQRKIVDGYKVTYHLNVGKLTRAVESLDSQIQQSPLEIPKDYSALKRENMELLEVVTRTVVSEQGVQNIGIYKIKDNSNNKVVSIPIVHASY